ncbi:BON domain-containing protein [Blastopirellula marina]
MRSSFGQFGGLNSLFGNQAFQNGFGQNNQPRIPTRLSVKFDYQVIPTPAITQNITERITLLKRFPNVEVTIADRVATVTGSVETESDSQLVDRFVGLEPGVSSVENQLEVLQTSVEP